MSKKNNTPQSAPQNRLAEYAIIVLIFLAMSFMIVTFSNREFSYQQYNTSTLEYVRGKVVEVSEEELSETANFTGGWQMVKVEILQGKAKGQVVEVENYITSSHNVIAKKGGRVIVRTDMPEGITPNFQIYNYDRSVGTFGMVLLFLAVVVIIGGRKGFMSCLGLAFTLCTVICLLLPSIFEGGNAWAVSVLTIILSTLVSCFCVCGVSRRTYINFLNTVLGTISAGVVYLLFMWVLGINGTNMSEAEQLILISNHTGLQLNGVLFAGVLVSTLGAVMDVAVSMGASLNEIRELNPKITPKELFRSGMNIGRDMIGTMTNTLILAFAGGTLATLLTFLAIGLQFHQLLSSNFLALEIASGIAGSMGVVLTVPISAAICSFHTNKKKIKNK